jgi:hypothetical protein
MFFIECLNLNLDFEFVCCLVHLLWNLIFYSYVVCSYILELDFQTNFEFDNVCVLCVHLLH